MTESTQRMQMTPQEIRTNYRQAKNQTEQIQILADLNAVSPSDILSVLVGCGEIGEEMAAELKAQLKKGKGWTPEEIRRLQQLSAQGSTRKEIAQTLGRTEASVMNKLHQLRLAGLDPKEADAGNDDAIAPVTFGHPVEPVVRQLSLEQMTQMLYEAVDIALSSEPDPSLRAVLDDFGFAILQHFANKEN